MPSLDDLIRSRLADFISLRHKLHQNPRLAFDEEDTVNVVKERFKQYSDVCEIKDCGKSGLIIDLYLSKHGMDKSVDKIIAFRADMDALPLTEITGADYASDRKGVMHACGHDGHTTALVAAGELIADAVSNSIIKMPQVCLRLIFQPAEETGMGAADMITHGCLKGVSEIYGIHNWPTAPLGHLFTKKGNVTAAIDTWHIHITGKGGHPGMPETCSDVITCASNIVLSLQTVISGDIAAQDPALLSTCQMKAGETTNVMPTSAMIGGSVRSYSDKVTERIKTRVQQLAENIATAYECTAEVKWNVGLPCVTNHPTETDHVVRIGKQELGPYNSFSPDDLALLKSPPPSGASASDTAAMMQLAHTPISRLEYPIMGSEDFGLYTKLVPGNFFLMGGHNPTSGPVMHMLHTPTYDFNDDLLPFMIRMWARICEDRLCATLFTK